MDITEFDVAAIFERRCDIVRQSNGRTFGVLAGLQCQRVRFARVDLLVSHREHTDFDVTFRKCGGFFGLLDFAGVIHFDHDFSFADWEGRPIRLVDGYVRLQKGLDWRHNELVVMFIEDLRDIADRRLARRRPNVAVHLVSREENLMPKMKLTDKATHPVQTDFSMVIEHLAGVSATFAAGSLTVQIDDPLPEGHPIFALVGRVASEWARYEGILDAIIWDLSGMPGPAAACITAQMIGSGPRLAAIKALLIEFGKYRKTKGMPDGKVEQGLGKIEADTQDLQIRRNRAVHDPWYWDKSTRVTKQQKSKPKNEWVFGLVPVESARLEDILKKIVSLSAYASQFRCLLSSVMKPSQPDA